MMKADHEPIEDINNSFRGILWMVLGTFCGASSVAIVRHLRDTAVYEPVQLVLFCYFFALPWVLPWAIKQGRTLWQGRPWKWYILRSILELLGFTLCYYAITQLPLPAYIALGFMTPLFLSTAAVLLLGEPHTRHTWLALAIGSLGVLIVARPGSEIFNVAALLILAACICFAACGIIIKRLALTQPPLRITFFMTLLTSLFALPFALPHWKMPEGSHYGWLVLLGGVICLQQFSVTKAFSIARLTVVLPFTFLSLVFTAVFAWVFFDQIITPTTLLGGAVILSSTYYARAHAKYRVKTLVKHKLKDDPPISQ